MAVKDKGQEGVDKMATASERRLREAYRSSIVPRHSAGNPNVIDNVG